MNLTRRNLITQSAPALAASLAFTTPLQLIAKPLAPSPTKLLFDTDIGSDIDDAVALAYLLMQPSIDLLGITTVTGEARKRAALARRLLELAGQTVPIFPGFEAPRQIATRQPIAQQAVKLSSAQLIGTDRPHNPEAN